MFLPQIDKNKSVDQSNEKNQSEKITKNQFPNTLQSWHQKYCIIIMPNFVFGFYWPGGNKTIS